jgi:hypothetical protein
MKFRLITLFALAAIMLSTCTRDVYNPDVCFQENVLPIFVSNCTRSGCHNPTDHEHGYDLTTYEGIMKGVTPKHPLMSEVYKVIRGNNPSMPPDGKLSSKEISYIDIWIKMGANNSSNCQSCDSADFSFANRIQPLFDTWCTGCHSPGNAGGGYDFTNYSGIVASIPGNKLQGDIRHLPGYIPMPQNTNSLSYCNIRLIEKWINDGYPDN